MLKVFEVMIVYYKSNVWVLLAATVPLPFAFI